jgi:hypothetical protein
MAHHHACEYSKHHKSGNLELAMHHKEACESCGGTITHGNMGECYHSHPGINGGSMYECPGNVVMAETKKKKGDGNLANNYPPFDKVTRGDVVAGRLGKDQQGGKTMKEAKAKCCCEEKGKMKCPVHKPMNEAERTMSRAAKGHQKYGKEGMAALAKAGKEGKDLDKIRDKYDKYDESAKPSAGLSAAKKSATVKKAKAGGDIGKPGKGFDKLAKKAGGGEKGEKIAAAAMWKNMKETVAYMAEKKAISKKDTVAKGDKMADEGNEFSGELAKAKAQHKDSFSVDGKTYPVKESSEFTRMQEQMARLNRNEKPALVENREVDQIRALTKRLLG